MVSRKPIPRARSIIEETLVLQVRADGLPAPTREHRFHPVRKWRFDLAWPDRMLGVECEGATWVNGRHTTGAGFEKDCEKLNAAQLMGWRVLRYTRGMVERGEAIAGIRLAIETQSPPERALVTSSPTT